MAPIPKSYVDVLIVGAGPAGLMCALWMSRCGIKTRLVDKRGTKVFHGQADGLNCRTLEIFDSFGFAHRAWLESNHMLEICFWNPDENGVIRRSDRIADTIPGSSRYQQCVLHQGRIERFLLDSIKEHSDIIAERGILPERLEVDLASIEDKDAYPITVSLRHLTEEESTPDQTTGLKKASKVQNGLFRSNLAADDTEELLRASKAKRMDDGTEIVRAKYMIGCDGAHSWTRKQLGFYLEGEQTEYLWGVLDIIPITDFPDIRVYCTMHSANFGSVMVIPRENKLVRLYTQLKNVDKNGGRFDRSDITPAVILEAAQKIFSPYKLTYQYCDWWTAYQIGQRVGSSFSAHDRIFLAGDAVHTHSPKAGQGMNVSMQDTYNLGWKIASVVKGLSKPSILKTYETERLPIAKDLIAFDYDLSRLFSGRPAQDIMDAEGIDMKKFKQELEKGNMFGSGVGVNYDESILVAKNEYGQNHSNGVDFRLKHGHVRASSKPELATHIKIGKRLPSYQVLNQSDARPWQFQELLKSNGRWRLIVYAGNLSDAMQAARVQTLGERLSSPGSFIQRYTAPNEPIDSTIEVLMIHSAPRVEVELLKLHEIYHPFSEAEGWDYGKVFVDDMSYHEGHGYAYENYGVDAGSGCAVILRPDQYVGWLGELEDVDEMDKYFAGFMIPQHCGSTKMLGATAWN